MSLRKRIIMNAGSNWVGMFVNAAIGFFLVRIIWRSLGPDSFGVWALLSTGLRYPMIFESAFSLSTNRFVAFYKNDFNQMNRFISASFVILLGLSVLTVLVIAILSFFVSSIFTAIPSELATEAKVTCILVDSFLEEHNSSAIGIYDLSGNFSFINVYCLSNFR
jgi:O-antigen/teichoic acid export membrane protein